MEPNKDNFMVSYIGIHDSRDNEKLKEQIFKWKDIADKWNKVVGGHGLLTTPEEICKWKEDSEQWKIYLDGGMNNLFEIHERLKKYLKNIDTDILDKEKVCLCDEYGCEDSVRKAVQKILGEKND